MHFTKATALAALAALLPAASADQNGRTFAVMHFYGKDPLVITRADPIVNPGTQAKHLHHVMGGNAFSPNMPGTTAKTATCTNTKLRNDKSNYWTPSLFFQHDNGDFTPVEMFYMNVYYFFDHTDDEIVPFPDGFRMLAGNPDLRTPPSTGQTIIDTSQGTIQPAQITCPRTNKNGPLYSSNARGTDTTGIADPLDSGAGAGFPQQNCDGYASPMRADIHFPACYNPAAGPENYQTNTAYPSSAGTQNGKVNCPKGYLHIPHLFYEVYWNTPQFAGMWTPGQGKQPFVWSNGDHTGYSFHGDFINGWDTNTLKTIIDTCDAGTSGMDKCPQILGGLTDGLPDCYATNPYPEPIPAYVTGAMKSLPGTNPITYGTSASSPGSSGSSGSPGSSGSSGSKSVSSYSSKSSTTTKKQTSTAAFYNQPVTMVTVRTTTARAAPKTTATPYMPKTTSKRKHHHHRHRHSSTIRA